MSTATVAAPAAERPAPAPRRREGRRAILRWSWRLFVREWRQQLLVLALITVAVGATLLASAVATNTPPPADAGFGTAGYLASFPGTEPHLAAHLAALERRFGPVQVIANKALSVPGSTLTFQLRSQDPAGPYGGPMLSLVSGRYPRTAGEIAVTSGVAIDFALRVGSTFRVDGVTRTVVGTVENPQSLLDEFALVLPGQVHDPTTVTALFDAHGVPASSIGPNVTTPALVAQHNPLNPETISLAVLTIGMLLIALVAIGGFTVLAQRRLRSLGMLAAVGATERQVGLSVRANGVVVGVAGALLGTVLGFLAWLAYRPSLEQSAHHEIGALALPWTVIGAATLLAIVASYFAASRPARTIARVPVVAVLSGRPPEPRKLRRSAVPGMVCLVIAFLLLGYSGGTNNGVGSGGTLELVLGLVALIPAVILLSPFCLTLLARAGRRTRVATRLALRDLDRYRARSGSALAAIALGVMIAVIIATVAAARYGNVLDYAGPNVAPNQVILWAPYVMAPGGYEALPPTHRELARWTAQSKQIAASIGADTSVAMWSPDVGLQHNAPGRQFSGTIYLATPQLLAAFGIRPRSIDPNADLLTMRPGFSSISDLQLQGCARYGVGATYEVTPGRRPTRARSIVCKHPTSIDNPVVQEVSALPSGTSAPNIVLTEHGYAGLHERAYGTSLAGWLLETPQAITGAQVHQAQVAAAAIGMSIESRNNVPASSTIINWATGFGMALALCILAMSVGLVRSETSGDLRTLVANGASRRARRALTAATAGALGLLGAVLGTVAGYVGVIGWLRDNSLNGGIAALGNVPARNLLILLVGLPLIAAAVGWLLAWREPSGLARQPIE